MTRDEMLKKNAQQWKGNLPMLPKGWKYSPEGKVIPPEKQEPKK